MRKIAKKCEKSSQQGGTSRHSAGYVYPPQEGAKPFQQESYGGTSDQLSNTQGGRGPPRIVTLREAKRCNAGVPVAKCEAAGDTQSVQEMTT